MPCEENGIVYDTSVPYCPETNGRIEREIGTIKDCARTLLIAANLPSKLWAEAVATTVYIHNRLVDKQSPTITAHESITGNKPSLAHARVFGCTAYSHVPHQRRRAWDPKGIKCVMVGYGGKDRKYKLYNPATNEVFEDRNVRFVEYKTEQISISTTVDPVQETPKQDVPSSQG
ncbi:unnamed protein product, partial [Allacma fusca]